MLKNENKIIKKNGSNKEKKKCYVIWPNNLHSSMDKTIGATFLVYSQFLITMNSSGTRTRVRVSPRWAYNILGHYIDINLISLTINIYSDWQIKAVFLFQLTIAYKALSDY